MSDELVELLPQVFTPLCDEHGAPRSRISPYLPVREACGLCPARCCRLNVKASFPDAVHYCRTLQVPFFAGLTFVGSTDPEHAFALDDDPRFGRPDRPWPGKAEILLRRREDGGCAGLVQVGTHERCGVYGARPSFCRTYPARWRAESMEGGPASILCPVPYGIDPEHEASLVAEIQRSIRYWGLHDALVAEWNDADLERTPRSLLEFMVPRVCDALEIDPGPTLAEGTKDQRLYDAMRTSKVVGAPKIQMLPEPERPFADLPLETEVADE